MSKAAEEALIRAQQELARRTLARRSLLHFTSQTLPGYQPGWVHHDIAARLQRFSQEVTEKKSPRLMLLVPPRHGKSELASIRLPAWHIGHNPEHGVINAGYNLDLPMIFSRKVRGLLRDPQYQAMFPDARLDPETQATEAWMTDKGGGFIAAGVGGGLTGKGANILIIDDPLKNMEEADSADRRQLIDEWYQSTAYTRLAPGGGVLLIETWWNWDDLAGRIQARMRSDPEADQFEVVLYPALSEAYEYRDEESPRHEIVRTQEPLEPVPPNYTLLRAKDEALHEDRYPTAALKRMRANMQPRIWSALYQQNPTPDEGLYFRKEQFRFEAPRTLDPHFRYYTAWDFAIGLKQQNDWTVGATGAHDDLDNVLVQEVNRFKGDSFEIVEAIVRTAQRYMALSDGNYLVGVEDGQIWRSISPLLYRRMEELKCFPTIEVMKPLTDKVARARPLQGRMQQGKIIFPEGASWAPVMLNEMLQFPGGAHDDIVDALSWLVRLTVNNAPPRLPAPPKVPSWRDKLLFLGTGQGATHMSA